MQQTGRVKSTQYESEGFRHKAKSVRKVKALGKERLSKKESLDFLGGLFITKNEHACSRRG